MRTPQAEQESGPATVEIRAPGRIAAILAQARRAGTPLAMRDPSGREYRSRILSCNGETPHLHIAEPEEGWPRAAATGALLTCSLAPEGLEIGFSARVGPHPGDLHWPEAIQYRECRHSFRAAVQVSEQLPVLIDGVPGTLANLSFSGFGAWFDAGDAPSDEHGCELSCRIDAGTEGVLELPVWVRHSHTENGRTYVGGAFASHRPEDQQLIRRWSIALERQALRRRQLLEGSSS